MAFSMTGHLALVKFEVDDLPRFGRPPRQFLLNRLLLEVLLRHLTGFVHPGCTIEVLPVPPCQFDQLDSRSLRRKVEAWPKFANCFLEVESTNMRGKDLGISIVLWRGQTRRTSRGGWARAEISDTHMAGRSRSALLPDRCSDVRPQAIRCRPSEGLEGYLDQRWSFPFQSRA
jgi:hypothetical protein